MIKVLCDKCGKDCGLNAMLLTIQVIHNPSPINPLDGCDLKITDDKTFMKMCLCSDCYGKLNFPNIYTVQRTRELKWKDESKQNG